MTAKTTIDKATNNSTEELSGFMDLQALDELLEENIRLLDEKLDQFRHDFNLEFFGYSPEFFADILFVNNLKINSDNKSIDA